MYLRYFDGGGETEARQTLGEMYRDLSTSDKQRLWSLAADIFAVVDPEPFTSVGAGLTSDYLNTKADLADYGWSWKTAKNFATNLGLTALSAIPVVGGALGSAGKAMNGLKSVVPWLTKAAMLVAASGAVANGPEMIRSIESIKNGNYTMDDLRNAGMLLQTVLGGANAWRRKSQTGQNMRNRGNEYLENANNAWAARQTRIGEKAIIDAQIKSNNGKNYLAYNDRGYWRGNHIVRDPNDPLVSHVNVIEFTPRSSGTQTAVLGYPRFVDQTLPPRLQSFALEHPRYDFEIPGNNPFRSPGFSSANSYAIPIENIRLSEPHRFRWENSQFEQYARAQNQQANLYYQLADMFSGWWPRRIVGTPVQYARIIDVHNW